MVSWLMALVLAAALYYKLGPNPRRGLISIVAGVLGLLLLVWLQSNTGVLALPESCTKRQQFTMHPESCARGVAAGYGLLAYGIAALAAATYARSR